MIGTASGSGAPLIRSVALRVFEAKRLYPARPLAMVNPSFLPWFDWGQVT